MTATRHAPVIARVETAITATAEITDPDATMLGDNGRAFRVTSAVIEWTRDDAPAAGRTGPWRYDLRGFGFAIKADGTVGKAARTGYMLGAAELPAWAADVVTATHP